MTVCVAWQVSETFRSACALFVPHGWAFYALCFICATQLGLVLFYFIRRRLAKIDAGEVDAATKTTPLER